MFHTAIARTARRVAIAIVAAAAFIGGAIAYAVEATALPDVRVPAPPFWCPGNSGPISSSGYGGYCEGKPFPDGSKLNTWRLGVYWQPLRCIVPDGTPNPPLAGPNGCGGVLG